MSTARGHALRRLVASGGLALLASGCALYDAGLLAQGRTENDEPGPSPGDEPPTTVVAAVGGTVASAGGATMPAPTGGGGAPASGGTGSGGTTEPPPIEPQGGAPASDCEAYPLSSRVEWSATASRFANEPPLNDPPGQAIDANFESRWSTGAPMTAGDWIEVDFGRQVALSGVMMHHDHGDHARAYEMYVSDSGEPPPEALVASGTNAAVTLRVTFDSPAVGRFLLVRQTGAAGSWWSVTEMTFECED